MLAPTWRAPVRRITVAHAKARAANPPYALRGLQGGFETRPCKGLTVIDNCSRWRGEGLSLFHNIGDQNSGLGVARLAARMGRFGRYLEGISCFEHAGRLALYGKLEAAFQDIGGFGPRMRMS